MTTANKAAAAVATAPAIVPTAKAPAAAVAATLDYTPGETHGPARKYGALAATVPCADVLYRLTKNGAEAAATGRGKSGRYTVQALVCMAAKQAGATQAKPVNGLAIVKVLANDTEIAAKLATCKIRDYAPGGKLPCPKWLSEYVTGNARANPGLLAKA